MLLAHCINQAKDLGVWIHARTNGRNFFNENHQRIAHSILQLSEDISDAIIILIESNLPGPAMSLARPLFESYVRGFWLLNRASDEQVTEFIHGKCPKLSMLVTAIGKDEESGGAWIHATSEKNLIAFNDLTHGGSEHARRRNKDNSVEPNYPEQELKSLIFLSNEIRIRIGVEIFSALNDEVALMQLHNRAEEFRASSEQPRRD